MLFGLYEFKAGSKGGVIYVLLLLSIYYHYQIKRLSVRWIISAVVLLIPLFSVYSHVRYTSSITQMLDIGLEVVKDNPIVLLPIAFGEFTGPPQTLVDLIEFTSNNINNFNFGFRWLMELLVFVPSFILSDRPLPSSELYMQLFRPDALSGAGEGWFIINDGYWAFGFVGVAIIMFLFGKILKLTYKFFLKNIDNTIVMFAYPYIYFVLVITSVRTGFFGSLKVSLMYFCSFCMLYLVARLVKFDILRCSSTGSRLIK